MPELTRTVRFCLNGLAEADPTGSDPPDGSNTFAAWPAMRGLGRFYELHVRCGGEADPATGYFLNIKHIDAAVRHHVLPCLREVIHDQPDGDVPMGRLMQEMFRRLGEPLGNTVQRLRLVLTPLHSLEIARAGDAPSAGLEYRPMDQVIIRQQYEFSAAHRLHVPAYSEQRNREIFGKCNNPSGHGHNYRLELAVRAPIDAAGRVPPVEQLDRLVDREVIEKLDHKHLNLDVPDFAERNPSVEHIAQTIWRMLVESVAELEVTLEEVSVWETDKTVCTYRGA